MNKLKQDELDAFLWEVETVSKQVKDILDGTTDIDKLMEKEKLKKEKEEKEEKIKILKQEEEKRAFEEKLQNGVKGKGEKDNYKKFCKGCFIEYEIDTIDKCKHCNTVLITREARHSELQEKLELLKAKKTRKIVRKNKFENWLKTESILKTSKLDFQSYHKWDLYESSTDEDEKGEPILPRQDPNFMAMEKDLIETEKKREISRNKSNNLKESGNKMMKEGKYKKAVKLYTEAIEETKSVMVLYTNRALAYFKLEDYQKSITDCDRVIEYLEIFEDQISKNKETYVKAITRKALCCQKMKNYEEAKSLIAKAGEYIQDEEIAKLEKNILMEEEVHLKALNLITGDLAEFEKYFEPAEANTVEQSPSEQNTIETNTDDSLYLSPKGISLIKNILEKNENNRLFFIQKGGLELVFTKSILEKNIELIELIEVFHQKRDGEERSRYMLLINNIKGYNKLIRMLFNQSETEKKYDYKYIKLIVSILEDSSHLEEVRKSLHDIKEIDKLFKEAFSRFDISDKSLMSNEQVVVIIMHLFTFIGNLCYSGQDIRQKISTQFSMIIERVYKFLEFFEVDNIIHRNILETVLSFLINLSCDDKFRENLGKETKLIRYLITRVMKGVIEKFSSQNQKIFVQYDDIYEKICCLIYNLTFTNNNNISNTTLTYQEKYVSIEYYIELGIIEIIKNYLEKIFNTNFDFTSEASVLRTLMLTSKLTKSTSGELFGSKFYNLIISVTNKNFLKRDSKFVDNTIKILAHYLQNKNKKIVSSEVNLELLSENLREIFLLDYPSIDRDKEKERTINNMSLMISLVGNAPSLSEKFREIVKLLIEIAKEKMDLLRKNSAILLAKIAKSSKSMENCVRELHGMDVLMNVSKFIQINK